MTDVPLPVPGFRESLGGGFVFTVEADMPSAAGISRFLAEARALRGKAAAVVLSERPVGGRGMSPLALACLVRESAGVDAIPPLSFGGWDGPGDRREVLGAAAMGVETVVAAGGLPGKGAAGGARRPWTGLFVGVRLGPGTARSGPDGEGLSALAARGARFIVTGPVFLRRQLEGLLQEAAGAGLPVIAGILPIPSHNALRALEGTVPVTAVPPEIRDRLAKTPGERVREESALVCREAIEGLREVVAGAHIMPGGDPSLAREVLGAEKGEGQERDEVERAVAEGADGSRISCRSAFGVAAEQGIPVGEVGRIIQRRKIKIVSCQLGCFR